MNGDHLDDLESKVVDLIEEGYARWKIAEMLGIGETAVRGVIRRLCEHFDCSMRSLPDVVRQNDLDSKGE